MKASELDKKFDENETISEYLDFSKSRRPTLEERRLNIDFSNWIVGLFVYFIT